MSKNKYVVKAEGGKSNIGVYIVSIVLALLSILPFWIMIWQTRRVAPTKYSSTLYR